MMRYDGRRCPNCRSTGYTQSFERDASPARPARPSRFFGLIAARPAQPAKPSGWRTRCLSCGFDARVDNSDNVVEWYSRPTALRASLQAGG